MFAQSHDGLSRSWSLFAIRITRKKCISLGTSQTFSLWQTSHFHFIFSSHAIGLASNFRCNSCIAPCQHFTAQELATRCFLAVQCRRGKSAVQGEFLPLRTGPEERLRPKAVIWVQTAPAFDFPITEPKPKGPLAAPVLWYYSGRCRWLARMPLPPRYCCRHRRCGRRT